jgi:hypothetical protein
MAKYSSTSRAKLHTQFQTECSISCHMLNFMPRAQIHTILKLHVTSNASHARFRMFHRSS